MKNSDILLGAAIGAAIVGAVVCGVGRRADAREEERKCCCCGNPPKPEPPPCDCFCLPPCREKPKKKDPCKGCYYEKYERKPCER